MALRVLCDLNMMNSIWICVFLCTLVSSWVHLSDAVPADCIRCGDPVIGDGKLIDLLTNLSAEGTLNSITCLQCSTVALTNDQMDASLLNQLASLQFLDLSNNNIQSFGDVSAALGPIIGGLEVFDISNNDFSADVSDGEISELLGAFRNVKKIKITQAGLNGLIPPGIGFLTTLTSLEFGDNEFSGPIPSEIGKLDRLEVLRFDDCRLTGELPNIFLGMPNLRDLFVDGNDFEGTMPAHEAANFDVAEGTVFSALNNDDDNDDNNADTLPVILAVVGMIGLTALTGVFIFMRKRRAAKAAYYADGSMGQYVTAELDQGNSGYGNQGSAYGKPTFAPHGTPPPPIYMQGSKQGSHHGPGSRHAPTLPPPGFNNFAAGPPSPGPPRFNRNAPTLPAPPTPPTAPGTKFNNAFPGVKRQNNNNNNNFKGPRQYLPNQGDWFSTKYK